MDKKRPSLISIIIILVIVVLLIVTIILFIKAFTNNNDNLATNKTDGKENVLTTVNGDNNYIVENNGKKVNTSKALQEDKKVDNLVFESFTVTTYNNVSTVEFEVYNPTDTVISLGKYELKILDDNANVIDTIRDEISNIDSLSRKSVSLEVNGDIANLNDIKVEKVVVVKM